MAITQTSKIQIRSGNLADLPQLSVGELGWAVDEKRLFIGNGSDSFTQLPQNTEILTVLSDLPTVNFLSANNINVSNTIQTINLTTGGNTVAGNITGDWTLTPGSRIHTLYADMAERYSSDADYPPGTVMMIGGSRETTIATHSGRQQLAGIVSSEPAYIMNSVMKDSVVIALIGRVPCKVVGTISKGDLLTISEIPGVATSITQPEYGTIIGRALEPYDSDAVGLIEVKVDRG